MIIKPVQLVVVLVLGLTACSSGGSTGVGGRQFSSARLESLLVARSRTAVPSSWSVTKQSDGPKNQSAEELFFTGTGLVDTVKVALTSSTTPSQEQSLNVAVDKRLLQHPQVTMARLRTRTGSVTADQVSGFDTTVKHVGTHVEFTVGSIDVSVLASDEALALQVARAQAAMLPPAP